MSSNVLYNFFKTDSYANIITKELKHSTTPGFMGNDFSDFSDSEELAVPPQTQGSSVSVVSKSILNISHFVPKQ